MRDLAGRLVMVKVPLADIQHPRLVGAHNQLSGYLANGLYSVTALILALGTRSRYPRWVWSSGIGVGLSGFALSVACLLDWVGGMFWSNVFLGPLILVWLAGVGLSRSPFRPA